MPSSQQSPTRRQSFCTRNRRDTSQFETLHRLQRLRRPSPPADPRSHHSRPLGSLLHVFTLLFRPFNGMCPASSKEWRNLVLRQVGPSETQISRSLSILPTHSLSPTSLFLSRRTSPASNPATIPSKITPKRWTIQYIPHASPLPSVLFQPSRPRISLLS